MKKTIRQEIIKIVNDAQIKFPPSRPMGNMLECIFIDKLQELFETTSMRAVRDQSITYETAGSAGNVGVFISNPIVPLHFKCPRCGAEWKHKCAEHKIDKTMIDEDI